MNIKIICVGKIKEAYFRDAIYFFENKIRQKVGLNIIEVRDEPCPEGSSTAKEEDILNLEGERILQHIKRDDFVVCLAIEGEQHSSAALQALFLQRARLNDTICFIIGGSLGLSSLVKQKARLSVSFSNMTFPHQLMRLILLEELASYMPKISIMNKS